MGKEIFWNVDYNYVVYSSYLCDKFNIPHYSLVSSASACANSMFYYLEVKGKAEDALKIRHKEKKIGSLSIFQPGMITDRDNDKRIGEKILSWIPFISKIKSAEIGIGMAKEAERLHNNYEMYGNKSITYSNKEIKNLSELKI